MEIHLLGLNNNKLELKLLSACQVCSSCSELSFPRNEYRHKNLLRATLTSDKQGSLHTHLKSVSDRVSDTCFCFRSYLFQITGFGINVTSIKNVYNVFQIE